MPETEKLYDTSMLIQTHDADAEFIKHMASLFIKHLPEMCSGLEKAYIENDAQNIYFFAHKMKASVELFNLNPLKEPIYKIEHYTKTGGNISSLQEDVDFITNYIQQCIADMREEFGLE